MYTVYLRGQAFLAMHKWNEAETEFQKITAHRGLVWNFPLGALVHFQLARAYSGMGDQMKAKQEFKQFLDLWDGADSEVPILRDAKSEYAKL